MLLIVLTLLVGIESTSPVAGRVREEGRLEPVPFAVVEVGSTGARVQTDQAGLFVVEVPEGDAQRLFVRAPGFRSDTVLVAAVASERAFLDLRLEPSPVEVEGLVAGVDRIGGGLRRRAPEARVIRVQDIDRMPALLESDVGRAIQSEPSVSASSDFSTAPLVRGGSPGQTRVFLDGMPVYNAFHLGGFVSAFTPSAISAAVLRPGGLSASAPSSLSGLIEVHTRDGGRNSIRASGSVGLLSASATVDGPLPSTAGSFLVSGRRTYVDAAVGGLRALSLTDREVPYRFSDFMAKVTFDVGRSATVAVAGYLNRERYDESDATEDPFVADWGSDALSVRLRGVFGRRWSGEAGLGTSGFFSALLDLPSDSLSTGLDARLRTVAADLAMRRLGASSEIVAGLRWEGTRVDHLFDTGSIDRLPELDVDGSFGGPAAFLDMRWQVSSGLTLAGGVRSEWMSGGSHHWLPRFRSEWSGGHGSSVSATFGRYAQGWWSPRNEESVAAAVVGYDLPIPVAEDAEPSTGWDAVFAGRHTVGPWALRTGVFLKRLKGVPVSPVPDLPLDAAFVFPVDDIRLGDVEVHGLEVAADGSVGGTSAVLSYRWQRERHRSDGEAWRPRTDRPHGIRLLLHRGWGERRIAVGVALENGWRYTPIDHTEPWPLRLSSAGRFSDGVSRLVMAHPNSASLPAYLRVDVDLRDVWSARMFGRESRIEPYLSLLNVTGRVNSLFVEYEESGRVLRRKRGPQIPLLPSFGIRWRW